MTPGGAVETRDREIIKALQEIFTDLSGRGRRVIGLFTKDPRSLLQLVSTTQEREVLGEVRFINSYPEYRQGDRPRRTSDHGTWHLRETTEIYNEHGNRIGFMTKYDYRPRRNGGREQGSKLGLREYANYPVGLNEHSLCIIYVKRPKKKYSRNVEGVPVQSEPDEAPQLQMAAANPNYAAGPSSAALGALEVVPMASPFAPAAADDDGFGFRDMTSYNDFGSLDFNDEGWKDSRYDHHIYQIYD